jgi:hypothetical protein
VQAQLDQLIGGMWRTQTLCAAVRLGVIDAIGEQSKSAADVAVDCGTDVVATQRLLDALTALGACNRTSQLYRLTQMGQQLRRGVPDSSAAWLLWVAHCSWDAWGKLADAVKTGNAFHVDYGLNHNFERFAAEQARSDTYNTAMCERTSRIEQPFAQHVAQHHPHTRTVADLGGGYGQLLAAVLDALPSANGVVVDLEHARAGAESLFAQRGLSARAHACTHNFFTSVPSADLYLLKSVLHNWSDAHAAALLANIRKAMYAESRLLILETRLPDASDDITAPVAVHMSDLNMLVNCGGRERSLAELDSLLHAAGLKLVQYAAIEGSNYTLITAQLL